MISIMLYSISALFETGRVLSLDPKQTVFQTGDRVKFMFLVTEGQIDLMRHTNNGTPLILNRAGPGKILAEASAYSQTYHCDGTARSRTQLTLIPVTEFHRKLYASPDMMREWTAQLAHELQKTRLQSEIRSLKTVSERLDAWLGDNHTLPPRGHMQDLAHILGVSREALYRELARRRG